MSENEEDKKSVKVLYLDIDGVLNSQESMRSKYEEERPYNDNPTIENLKRLERIIAETGCCIVISSTWRKSFRYYDLANLFYAIGMDLESTCRIVDQTPVLNNNCRGDEILVHILGINNGDKNYHQFKDERINKICILDDDSDMGFLQKYHISVSNEIGLTDKNVDDVIAMLNSEETLGELTIKLF